MKPKTDVPARPSLQELLFGGGTPKKALLTALLVGSILTIINHGDLILAGEALSVPKVLLTYCVPYCVTTWGAVTGKLSAIDATRDPETPR